eukprot:COSAG01_NODE_4495_length_4976_cov_16.463605_2_plen_37_part_00
MGNTSTTSDYDSMDVAPRQVALILSQPAENPAAAEI